MTLETAAAGTTDATDNTADDFDAVFAQLVNGEEDGTPAATNTDVILGIGKVAKKVVMLLDADKVLSSGELANIGKIG